MGDNVSLGAAIKYFSGHRDVLQGVEVALPVLRRVPVVEEQGVAGAVLL